MEAYSNVFGEKREEILGQFSHWKTRMLTPLLFVLDRLGLTADALSLLSFSCAIGCAIVVSRHVGLACAFLVGHAILDGFDGSLARYQQRVSKNGAFMDFSADQASLVVITLAFLTTGSIPILWGAWYLSTYLIMVPFLVFLNHLRGKPVKTVIRSRFLFYILFFVDYYFGLATVPAFLLVFSLYNTVVCFILFRNIRCLL
ncbi:MAG: CDP-alcohol phosphatidyltransferase family protein [Candidatus Peribacteraceae bacterium]|nr:CDP-alcohol phosphatidyltransferase family protein [Candidatus Peribacteraceae bacterium]